MFFIVRKYTTVKRWNANRQSRMFLQLPDLTQRTSSNAMMNRLSRMVMADGGLSNPTRQRYIQNLVTIINKFLWFSFVYFHNLEFVKMYAAFTEETERSACHFSVSLTGLLSVCKCEKSN